MAIHGIVPFLQIEPTTRCNFTCGFCAGRQMTQSDMNIETFEAIISTMTGVRHIELQGEGEPLLVHDFFEMVQCAYALQPGVDISFITNGSFFTRSNNEL